MNRLINATKTTHTPAHTMAHIMIPRQPQSSNIKAETQRINTPYPMFLKYFILLIKTMLYTLVQYIVYFVRLFLTTD